MFYYHLVQFSVSTIDGRPDVETKFNFTTHTRQHINKHHSDSHCNPLTQIGERFYSFAIHNFIDLHPEEEGHGC
jgi:hypothetical protein